MSNTTFKEKIGTWKKANKSDINNDIKEYIENELLGNGYFDECASLTIRETLADGTPYDILVYRAKYRMNNYNYYNIYDRYIGIHDNTYDYRRLEILDRNNNLIANGLNLKKEEIKVLQKKMSDVKTYD